VECFWFHSAIGRNQNIGYGKRVSKLRSFAMSIVQQGVVRFYVVHSSRPFPSVHCTYHTRPPQATIDDHISSFPPTLYLYIVVVDFFIHKPNAYLIKIKKEKSHVVCISISPLCCLCVHRTHCQSLCHHGIDKQHLYVVGATTARPPLLLLATRTAPDAIALPWAILRSRPAGCLACAPPFSFCGRGRHCVFFSCGCHCPPGRRRSNS